MAEKKEKKNMKVFKRSKDNRVIGGVCGGLGEYFNIDPLIFRILFILLAVYGGSGIVIYIILWIAVPQEGEDRSKDFEESIKQGANKMASEIKDEKTQSSGRLIGGLILVIIGLLFLLENLFPGYWLGFAKLWPLIIVAIGFSIIINSQDKE